MKKILSLVLSVMLTAALLAGCSGNAGMEVDKAKAANPDYVGSTSNGEYNYDVYKTHIELTKYIGDKSEVIIPDKIDDTKVTTIAPKVFADTEKKLVKKITIPASVTKIDSHSFYSAMGLEEIAVNSANTAYVAVDGVLYNKKMTEITAYPVSRKAETFEIPNTVTALQNSRFALCSNLKSIKIPNSVKTIGDYVFQGCTNLTEIVIPDSVTRMGSAVFLGCISMKTLTLSKNLESGDETMIWNCSSLKIIKGYTGSLAEQIAKKADKKLGIKFVSLGIYEKPTEPATQAPTQAPDSSQNGDPYQDPQE